MLAAFDQIDRTMVMTPATAESLLGVRLHPADGGTNDFSILQGSGGLWKKVELRLPVDGNDSRFVLILEPAAPLSMKEVVAHFGDSFAMESPNPAAGEQAAVSYIYLRPNGNIRFSFPSFERYMLRTILFDRA